jgi:hypothetical protein
MAQSAFRWLLVTVLATSFVACGGTENASKTTSQPPASDAAFRTSCTESWWPTAATFTNHHWRKESVTVGPVTFLNVKRLASIRITGQGSVKIRTLVRPRTPVTIAIGRSARGTAGFVPMTNGGEAGIEASRPSLHLAGCDGVPPGEQAIRGLADVGFPVFVAATRKTCVPMEITPDGGPTHRVLVSLGAGRCSAG